MAKKTEKKPRVRVRDHAREAGTRVAAWETKLRLTEEEAGELEALKARLGAPTYKGAIMASIRAAAALVDGRKWTVAREALRADLSPAKPGNKTPED